MASQMYFFQDTYGNELLHYGILGQKWGVRRYQNRDGSLTADGKTRYGSRNSRTQQKNKVPGNGSQNEKKKNKEGNNKRLNDARELAKEGRNLANTLRNRPKSKKKYSMNDEERAMTDEELSKKIKRINLENTYSEAVLRKAEIEKGKSAIDKVMDDIPFVLEVTTSAATTALLVQKLLKL